MMKSEDRTADNWSGGIAPETGEHVRFDNSHLGNTWTNATWNLEIERKYQPRRSLSTKRIVA